MADGTLAGEGAAVGASDHQQRQPDTAGSSSSLGTGAGGGEGVMGADGVPGMAGIALYGPDSEPSGGVSEGVAATAATTAVAAAGTVVAGMVMGTAAVTEAAMHAASSLVGALRGSRSGSVGGSAGGSAALSRPQGGADLTAATAGLTEGPATAAAAAGGGAEEGTAATVGGIERLPSVMRRAHSSQAILTMARASASLRAGNGGGATGTGSCRASVGSLAGLVGEGHGAAPAGEDGMAGQQRHGDPKFEECGGEDVFFSIDGSAASLSGAHHHCNSSPPSLAGPDVLFSTPVNSQDGGSNRRGASGQGGTGPKDPYNLRVVAHSLGGASMLMYLVMRLRSGQMHHVKRLVLLTPAGFHAKVRGPVGDGAVGRLLAGPVCFAPLTSHASLLSSTRLLGIPSSRPHLISLISALVHASAVLHCQVPWSFHPVIWIIPPALRLLQLLLGAGAGGLQSAMNVLHCCSCSCV